MLYMVQKRSAIVNTIERRDAKKTLQPLLLLDAIRCEKHVDKYRD